MVYTCVCMCADFCGQDLQLFIFPRIPNLETVMEPKSIDF